jgi:hypothetical protein
VNANLAQHERKPAWRYYEPKGVPFNDTWVLDLATERWRRPRVIGFFAGFDAERGRLIVFSGAQGMASVDPAKDTWSLDLASKVLTWRRLASGNEPGSPPGRRNGDAVFDPTGPRLFVFGGTADMKDSEPGLWAFDVMPGHERWYRIDALHPAPIRSSAIGFYDRHRGRVVLGFGNAPHTPFRDIWSVDTTDFETGSVHRAWQRDSAEQAPSS